MNRLLLLAPAAALVLAGCASNRQSGWMWDGRAYATREECLAAKRQAQARSATVGAATAGTAAAIAGGNLAETALVAGAGAAAGAAMSNRRC